jgi:Mrp family chromosome partitioning ATPase
MAHKHGCGDDQSCSSCGSSGQCGDQAEQLRVIQERTEATLNQIKHKVIVMSGKGGVGKSTVASNLAMSLAQQGFQVGLLDVDLHGPNLIKMFGQEAAKIQADDEGMYPIEINDKLKILSVAALLADQDVPIIWRGPMKHAVIQQFLSEVHWGSLDFLVMDLPPGTGDEPLSLVNILGQADGAIIVTTPQEVALLDSRKSVSFCRAMDLPVLGIVENMSGFTCPHCQGQVDIFKTGGGELAAKELGIPFLGRIPLDPGIVTKADRGQVCVSSMPDSAGAKAFSLIGQNLAKTLTRPEPLV